MQLLCPVVVDKRTKTFYDKYVAENQRLFDYQPVHPGKILKQLLEEKGWSTDELAIITGRRRQTVSEFISGKTGLTTDMAVVLAAAFGNTAAEWLKWDASYRLTTIEAGSGAVVEKRAKLYHFAPVKEMQKRGWIRESKELSDLEEELKAFFGSDSLDETVKFPVALLRHSAEPSLSPTERAWCFRARQLAAASMHVAVFDPKRLPITERRLRELAAHPKEIRYLCEVLAQAGVRLVVVEPLPGMKIDGAAFWLDEASPVIAVSGRIDRIDNIWFAVMHEWAHIRNGDAWSVDNDLLGDEPILIQNEAERRANEQAASALIPAAEMDSFIRRVGPLYSKTRIIQFAHRIKIHPGIIVGQLQHRKEVGYSSNREMLVKVREFMAETTLTDGWGRTLTPGILQ